MCIKLKKYSKADWKLSSSMRTIWADHSWKLRIVQNTNKSKKCKIWYRCTCRTLINIQQAKIENTPMMKKHRLNNKFYKKIVKQANFKDNYSN